MLRHVGILGASLVIAWTVGCSGDSSSPASDQTPDGSGGSSSNGGNGSSGSSGSSGGSSGGETDATVPTHDASSSGGSPDGSSSSSGGGVDAGYDPSVLQHHKNGTRDGVYIDPAFTKTAAASTHVLSTMGTVSAGVFAQPLYVENGPGGVPAFIVATETNHVTAINASTGVTLWDKGPSVFGDPATGGLACAGTINPLGITGTPIISDGVVYFDAMSTRNANLTVKHLVYALKVADGSTVPNWPVDVTATVPGFVSGWQNQRGALQLANGILYVPYGGIAGDCPLSSDPAGTYHGWVIGFPLSGPQHPTAWKTTAAKGGIWAPGSLPTDGTAVFPVTGNTLGNITWGGGEAVIRLTAGPAFSNATKDYYAPTGWAALDIGDTDLGGASNVLFDMPGASKPHLVAAGGKDANLYLLDRDNLGGIGGEILVQQVATGQIKGATAVYTTAMGTYVAFHVENGTGKGCSKSGNLEAVKIEPSGTGFKATVAWCSSETSLGSPMITTTDGKSNAIVWSADNALHGYDGDTGAPIVDASKTTMPSSMQNWNVPIAANGHIAVAINGALYLFAP
jgi:hypothetical protein